MTDAVEPTDAMLDPMPEAAMPEAATAPTRAPESLTAAVMGNPPMHPTVANLPEWRRAEIPAANGDRVR